MLKGIVFDLDGTLVDSLSVTFEAFNHAFKALGTRTHTPQEIMAYFGPGEGQIFERVVGADNAPEAYRLFRSHIDQHIERIPLHSGIRELLNQFDRAGIPVSIFTGRSWNTTEIILKHHGLLERFVTVVANDHVDFPKPSPEGLYKALAEMKIEPHEAVLVGDAAADVRAARAAGAQGVAALWDLLVRREELEPHRPDHWAERPSDVWEIWERQTRSR